MRKEDATDQPHQPALSIAQRKRDLFAAASGQKRDDVGTPDAKDAEQRTTAPSVTEQEQDVATLDVSDEKRVKQPDTTPQSNSLKVV